MPCSGATFSALVTWSVCAYGGRPACFCVRVLVRATIKRRISPGFVAVTVVSSLGALPSLPALFPPCSAWALPPSHVFARFGADFVTAPVRRFRAAPRLGGVGVVTVGSPPPPPLAGRLRRKSPVPRPSGYLPFGPPGRGEEVHGHRPCFEFIHTSILFLPCFFRRPDVLATAACCSNRRKGANRGCKTIFPAR